MQLSPWVRVLVVAPTAALVVSTAVPADSTTDAGAHSGATRPTSFPIDGHEHYGTLLNIVPPGSTGNVTSADLAALGAGNSANGGSSITSLLGGLANPQAFFTTATPTTPTNFANQLEMYDALNRANPSALTNAGLTKYFKDAPLGVDPRDVVRTETP